MIYIAAGLLILNAALIAHAARVDHTHSRERADRAAAYERTLQTMADRVQAPDRLPVRDAPIMEIPAREPDEYAQVGSIDIADDYGLTDD